MANKIEGHLNAKDVKIGIIISRFNDFITTRLLAGAYDCLERHGADNKKITEIWVPGSFEIPMTAKKVADKSDYDGIICLGAVIRGETPHFEYVASEVAKGVAKLSLEAAIPISFGILTTDTTDQAIERAGTKVGNKGWDAALSVLEMINLFNQLG